MCAYHDISRMTSGWRVEDKEIEEKNKEIGQIDKEIGQSGENTVRPYRASPTPCLRLQSFCRIGNTDDYLPSPSPTTTGQGKYSENSVTSLFSGLTP